MRAFSNVTYYQYITYQAPGILDTYSSTRYTVPTTWCLVVVVVLTLTRRYNAVRGHRTGSNNSGVEDYLTRKQIKTEDNTMVHNTWYWYTQ